MPALHQAKAFAETDASGHPTIAMCWDCGDTGAKLRPGVPLCMLLIFYNEADGSQDPEFHVEMDAARDIIAGKEVADFGVSSEVFTHQSYGLRMEQTFAVFTHEEMGPIAGRMPAELKKTKKVECIALPSAKPDQKSYFYIMDMYGLPSDIMNSCKKVTVYYDWGANAKDIFLANHMNSRPSQLRPMAEKPLTLQGWKDKISAAARNTTGNTGPVELDDDVPSDDEDAPAPNPVAGKRRAVGFAAFEVKPAAKGKAKAKSQPSQPVPAQVAAAAEFPSAPSAVFSTNAGSRPAGGRRSGEGRVADDQRSESTVAAGGKQNVLSKLPDDDMRACAKKHLACCPNSSVKSLEVLHPMTFLREGNSSKAISNSVTGAALLET
ncbi:unnamed protein product [Symbiodinium sp. CCMP2592]|nr:unnamed protein product [Symbiodinium sp. CCMP2592]